jgi:hypothetical protein
MRAKHVLELKDSLVRLQKVSIQKACENLELNPLWHLIVNIARILSLNSCEQIIVPPIVKVLLYLPLEFEINLLLIVEPTECSPEHEQHLILVE